MKTRTLLLALFAAFLTCGAAARADEPALTFYIVSKESVEGWKFFDSPDFPELGYISKEPDLVINQLKSVETSKLKSSVEMTDDQGRIQTTYRDILEITLRDEDAAAFTAMSRRAYRHAVLVMVGDKPLMAPVMRAPITTPNFNLDAGKPDEAQKIKEALAKLMKK